MISEPWSAALAGACFGAALTASRVYEPLVIIDQFRLEDFQMFHVFVVAVGSSATIMLTLERLGALDRPVRSSTSLGWFSRYDGNIVGGMMVGTGMALSGACPGTLLVQLAQGVHLARATAVGALLGACTYVYVLRVVKKHPPQQQVSDLAQSKRTISDVSQIPEVALYLLLGMAIITVLYATEASPSGSAISPLAGGLLIGLAQAVSLVLTASALGASAVYEYLGRHILRAVEGGTRGEAVGSNKSVVFALGAMAGSIALAAQGSFVVVASKAVQIPVWQAYIGGFVMVFGARLGGGCTSGHGLSGLSALSFSSLVSVVSMFTAGIVTRGLTDWIQNWHSQ